MTNEFTLENTKDAEYVHLSNHGVQFGRVFNGVFQYFNKETNPEWEDTTYSEADYYHINLTDQTGRGYPTLEWFLKCGHLIENGDEIKNSNGILLALITETLNMPSDADSEIYVISTHDNRHDLTAMARDEYYSKREKQWPTEDESARMVPIWQNGNNGEHYERKPVYTQEMHDNGELPPVGSNCLVKKYFEDNSQFQLCFIVGFDKNPEWLVFSDMVSNLNSHHIGDGVYRFKPIDTRTEEEKLRDAITDAVTPYVGKMTALQDELINSKKFTITLNEEG